MKPKNVKWHEETKLKQITALKESIIKVTEEKEKEKAEIIKETMELKLYEDLQNGDLVIM